MDGATRRIAEWRRDPLRFVREVFRAEPDLWQAEVLSELGKPGRKRITLKACAGPGKTAVLAWGGWHRLVCFAAPREHPKGIAVSITGDNLRNNLWAEMARWQNESDFLLKAFEWTSSRISARDHGETWFLAATSYPKSANIETIGRTLSGLHSLFPFYLIDESGDMPPNMLRSAEQGLSGCEDGLIITAGNTTSQTGLLYEASVRLRGEWEDGKYKVFSITADPQSPRRTPRVDIKWAQQQIDTYGRDNPWVMSYVLGEFPPGSINALMSADEVEAAMNREPVAGSYEWAVKRLGVDVARFGDDRTIHFPRQGLVAFKPAPPMRHARNSAVSVDIANRAMAMMNEQGIEESYFDDTVGWAHGAVDVMRSAGRNVYAVRFDAPSSNPRYVNMRAQMWMEMSDWIKKGSMPHIPEMIAEMTMPTYFFSGGKFQIEAKDQIKKRLGRSPDYADALALTFALPDTPARRQDGLPPKKRTSLNEYDPYAGMDR